MIRLSLFVSSLLAVTLLAGCQPVPSNEDTRTVTVSGEGEIAVAPEIATVRLSIEARDPDLAAAQQQASQVVDAVLVLAAEIGVGKDALQSTQLRVHPEFDWHEGRQTLRGYLVQREIRVELEDVAKLGPLLERAMRAGVNNISAPELDVKDPRKLHREVLQLAAADAEANAEALARTLGAELGGIRRLHAMEGGMPEPMAEIQMMRAKDAAGAEQSYTAGRITVRARVQAEFDLR